MEKYKIIFIGTPDFAVPVLESLIANRLSPVVVITESDKPKGRGRILTPSPVKVIAEKHKITVLLPIKIKNLKLKIENLQPDLVVVCAYGQIIPKEILEIPKYGALNIHPSLLPKYRGATPVQAAILNGDKETGVTIIKMDELLDHGMIVVQEAISLQPSAVSYPELAKKLSELGAKLLIKTLPDYLSGKIKPVAQNHKKATFTKLLKKDDGLINWQQPPEQIERQIRAYFPWPGTYTILNSKRFIIHKAHLYKNQLIIDTIQPEGKKTITFEEFKRGYPKLLTFFSKHAKI